MRRVARVPILAWAASCLLTAGSLSVLAQDEPVQPESAEAEAVDLGWPVARLAKQIRTINDFPAVGVGVAHRGDLVGLAADGLRRSKGLRRVTDADLWHIGSVTKSMTATLIALMVKEQRLTFDATLPDLLPDITMHAGWTDCTLHHVLTHTSGLPPNFPAEVQEIWPDEPSELVAARQAAVGKVLAKAPQTPCGSHHAYSNVGYVLAGLVAELAAGTPYEALLDERVFAPFGLTSAGFGAPRGDNLGDQPMGHAVARFGSRKTPVNPFWHTADNAPVYGPAGRVHMDLADLLAYGQAHLDGELGTGKHLDTAAWKRLHTPNLENYAYGWIRDERFDWGNGPVLWHNGSNTLWYTLLVLVPGRDAVMAFTTNEGSVSKAERAFFRAAAALAEMLPTSQPAPE